MPPQPPPPQDDPVVSRSYALHYLIAVVLLIGSLFWALEDEFWGQRPWKAYQAEFQARYLSFLKSDYAKSKQSEEDLKSNPDYQRLKQTWEEASQAATPRMKELNDQIHEASRKLGVVQAVFTDARARVGADTYQLETTVDTASRDRKLRELGEYRKKKQFSVDLPEYKGRQLNFDELEAAYSDLKDEKGRLGGELGELLKPVSEARAKLDAFISDQIATLTPEQIAGLEKKMREWDPQIRQINVNAANIVDRCESCHMGVREPVKLTLASMTLKGQKADKYAEAFVGHPMELLNIHDPEKFGCVACHGGNGRATTSVEKGHGLYEHWLWPLFAKENAQAGCQTCHAADMVLAKGQGPEMGTIIDQGKELFRVRGCNGCHRYEGYDPESEQLLAANQLIKQLEAQKREDLRQVRLLSQQGDQASDNAEAKRLYQQAENLRVGISNLDGRIEQVDLQARNLLRDQKKIGPNLKDIRAKLNPNWIPEWLHKPTEFRATTKMPNFRLSDAQRNAITAYLWQSALTDSIPKQKPGDFKRGQELFETRGCLGCHSIEEDGELQGGSFAADLSRVGEKVNYDYLARWVHNPRQRVRPYCAYEKKDIGPEDYAKKGLPYVFDLEHSTCPNDGHELQVQQMTVMPILRLSEQDAADVATYLMSHKKREPSSYADASAFMNDPKLKAEGKKWIRHFGCAGCHEISGFEDEGRIGTELTVEGSKPIERLDFALLTHPSKAGAGEPKINDSRYASYVERLPEGPQKKGESWYDHRGFFEHKLSLPNIYDYDLQGRQRERAPTEYLRMPDPHLTKDQIRALVTFLLGSRDSTQEVSLPAGYIYKPGDERRDIQEGWWIVKKYNCMGCHQFLPGQVTSFTQMKKYQDPDWKEQRPPQLLTEGARVDPAWMMRFLSNPALSATDTNRNGVRPYLKARMPTFNFSDNELRKLVRFFQALASQPMPYTPQRLEALSPQETEMARSLFTSMGAPCLKCHATGDPNHDKIATAPNFLMAKERLKPGWMERWIVDPQNISPGTSMPSKLFRKDGAQWVFNGPVPPSFQGYGKDHTKLLVRYMMELTAEEQRRAAAARAAAPGRTSSKQPGAGSHRAAAGGSR
ncbi:MAG TPA: c-type cytochrome [Terriglobales bacterium]|nr:c-type cytochrome [Terriglobales bacterium]